MSSSNFDAQILAAQQAKNALLKKIAMYAGAAIFAGAGIYLGTVWLGDTAFSPDDSTQSLTQSASLPEGEGSEDILSVAREELQQKLVYAENAVADIEQDEGRNNYSASAITALRNTLQLALGSYSSESYQQAGRQLKQLQTAVLEFEQGYSQAWQTAWQQAQSAFTEAQRESSNEALTQARLHNQKVLHLNPGYAPAEELQARLDVWQEVEQYQEQLRIAEVENNLEKQLALTQQILTLDPDNQDVANKASDIREQMKESRFADAIVRARSALASSDIAATQTALQQARAIDASRQEIEQIQKQVDEIVKNNSIARFEQQIATMQSVDNWAAAQRLSANAKAKHPEQENFELSLQLANQILAYQKQLDAYLSTPERLADGNIHSNAQRLLAELAPVEVASTSLKKSADELRGALDDSQETVAVTVLSDGRTDIRVLGTGVVGKTREKVIQLLPGSYRFEGRREGYQSKIVSFNVRATGEMQSLTLICDQKI